MNEYVLRRTDEFEVRGEFLWFGVVLHCDVFVRWSKGVRNRLRLALREIAGSISKPVYAFQTASHDPLKLKFIKTTGGVFHHRLWTPSGELADMFIYLPLD